MLSLRGIIIYWEQSNWLEILERYSCIFGIFGEGYFVSFFCFIKKDTHVAHYLRSCALRTFFNESNVPRCNANP